MQVQNPYGTVGVMFHALEHRLLAVLKPLPLRGQRLLVAVSGGVDSLAGLEMLCRVQKHLKFDLVACYIHHGEIGISQTQAAYRMSAAQHCEAFCKERHIPFFASSPALSALKSENELRVHRYAELRNLKQRFKCDWIITAHHRDDVLETQVMRLMRGVGKEGLRAILSVSKDLLRPFLTFSKKELIQYASDRSIVFYPDPSNADPAALRNQVRIWLAEMEARQPGVLNSFARSFDHISEKKTRPLPKLLWQDPCLSRSIYSRLTQEQRLQALVEYHKRHNLTQPRHTQLKEILRQLDMSKNEHIFAVGPYEWRINARRIWARERK